MEKPFEAMRSEKVTVTLTVGEIDNLFTAGHFALRARKDLRAVADEKLLVSALQKLDEAVNG